MDSTPQRRPYRRRTYLINRSFQLRFIMHMNMLSLVVIGIFYAANRFFFWELARRALDKGITPDHLYFKFLDHQRQFMDTVFAVTAAAVVVCLSAFGVLYSHRIAGPLYRLTKHLQNIAEGGKPGPVKFRKGDFFPEIATAYNTHLDKIINPAPPAEAPTRAA